MASGRRRQLVLLLLGVCALVTPAPAAGQEESEPILEEIQRLFQTPGLSLGFLLQASFDPGLDGGTERFEIGAARLRVSGVLDGGFDYRLQTNHAASPSLLDARLGWSYGSAFTIYAGRFKTPFSRELLTYAGSTDFISRSRVVSALAPNRQVGAQVGGVARERIGWSVGAFTGGRSQGGGSPLMGVARLEGRAIAVGEGSLSVAAHAALGRDGAMPAGPISLGQGFSGDGALVGVDFRYEADRLMLSGEVIRATWDALTDGGFGPDYVRDVDSDGFFATAGWMLDPKTQALVRWDRFRAPQVAPASAVPSDDDVLVLGVNRWPTLASEIQVNWLIPVSGSGQRHTLVINFQLGI